MKDSLASVEVTRDGQSVLLHLPPVAQIRVSEAWAPLLAEKVEFDFPEAVASMSDEEPDEELREACAGLADKLRQA